MGRFYFKVLKEDKSTEARVGEFKTPHGSFKTPCFMPVGTLGAVKLMTPKEIKELGGEIILTNIYHLYLRPGISVIKKLGGVHNFTGWVGPIFTDSGGYQVFSLAKLREIKNEGVVFRSHIDGSEHYFTPQRVIQYQIDIGADIITCLDECAPYPSSRSYTKEAMERTHRWAKLCLQKFSSKTNGRQVLFGITQGGFYKDLRKESAKFFKELPFFGYGIGGLSVGEPKNLTFKMLEIQLSILPKEKPKHMMGVGSPAEMLEAISFGIDMFDSVFPTRLARHGTVLTSQGKINIKSAKYKNDKKPLDEACSCYVCKNFSRAFLRHLFVSEEFLAHRLFTHHNLYFTFNLIKTVRKAILEGKFAKFKKEFGRRQKL